MNNSDWLITETSFDLYPTEVIRSISFALASIENLPSPSVITVRVEFATCTLAFPMGLSCLSVTRPFIWAKTDEANKVEEILNMSKLVIKK